MVLAGIGIGWAQCHHHCCTHVRDSPPPSRKSDEINPKLTPTYGK